MSEIDGGRASISGDHTVDEAGKLANLFKTSRLSCQVKIVKEKLLGK